ncbi:DUF1242-domain-containing protein [Botryosphaeria dothidea]|uniref:DUF1242-domain-containing protein n=1 Tax=Botryosphaeria dothidea TaxID=55169 RepID=A0A8H4NCS1_9PEZI|nr:DUF1242-domain-containing protein [Botryosphaeria dothidea]
MVRRRRKPPRRALHPHNPLQAPSKLINRRAHSLLRQTALFNFQSLLLVILLLICTSTYVHAVAPGIMDRNKDGVFGIFWKFARVGERLSPYVSLCCILMAVSESSQYPKIWWGERGRFTDDTVQASLFVGE